MLFRTNKKQSVLLNIKCTSTVYNIRIWLGSIFTNCSQLSSVQFIKIRLIITAAK